jgi:hypothetical protein
MTEAELRKVLDPSLYIGRCAGQVERFLEKVRPLLTGTPSSSADIEI